MASRKRRQHAARALEGAVDHAVQQVLDRPGEIADAARADDAPGTLQRVEGTAHASQRFAVRRVLRPQRVQAADGRDLLARLLDEQRQQLRIDGRASPGGVARLRGLRRRSRGAAAAARRAAGAAARMRIERDQAALGVVQHVPGIAAPGLQRLHVVLDADDGVREAVDVLVVARQDARAQQRGDVVADAPHHFHRAIAAEQQEARGDAAGERGCRIEAGLLVAGRVERVAQQLLDAREVHDALAQHRLGDLAEIRVGLRARRGRARRHDEPHEGVVEAVLDADQGRRDRDQRVLLGRRAARDDVRQARQLALDLLAHRAEAQHGRACRRSS